jgi:hypothetical protein
VAVAIPATETPQFERLDNRRFVIDLILLQAGGSISCAKTELPISLVQLP